MRQDLIKWVSGQKEITSAVILTHNIDFVFLQSVVLSALRQCGRPTLTVFADARCASASYAQQGQLVSSLGQRYRVVPVPMPPGFCFHPKAVFLSGTEGARLLVGSGNLTFGGWRENAEVWTLYDTDEDGAGPFSALLLYLRQILSVVPLSEPVRAEVEAAFNGGSRTWATNLEEPSGLLAKAGTGPSLLDQMIDALGTGPVDRLTVCSPYFDPEGEALRLLVSRAGHPSTEVLAEDRRSGLSRAMADSLDPKVRVQGVTFDVAGDSSQTHRSFIHAKFYAFQQDDRVTLYAGSANCSRAGLTIPGGNGNAELLGLRTLSRRQFEAEYLGELARMPDAPALPDAPPPPETPDPQPEAIHVTAARFDGSELLCAYVAPSETRISRCILDDVPKPIEVRKDHVVAARPDAPPRRVQLEGEIDGRMVLSPPGWVDHEPELQATARTRELVHFVGMRVRPEQWKAQAWVDLVAFLVKSMHSAPSLRTSTRPASSHGPISYQEEDVFIDASRYRLPSLSILGHPLAWSNRVRSLQQLLYQWLGRPWEDEADAQGPGQPPAVEGDGVDQPEDLPREAPRASAPLATDRERERMRRVLERVTQTATDPERLAAREPEYLAMDVSILAILLRSALCEGWLDRSDVLACTHRIWSAWFFANDREEGKGWLEWRWRSNQDPNAFASRMGSDELAAALAAWAMLFPDQITTPEEARFALACAVSVARLPWLWDRGERNESVKNLVVRVLQVTADPDPQQAGSLSGRWDTIMRRGKALRLLEKALAERSLAEIRQSIARAALGPGDLLWQGSLGFCVVTASGKTNGVVPVLKLQGQTGATCIDTAYITPVGGLLAAVTLSPDPRVDGQARADIVAFLEELAVGLRSLQGGAAQ